MQDPSIGIPHWSYIQRGNTTPISADPLRLNMSKINQAFRKQDRIKDLQKYECIIKDISVIPNSNEKFMSFNIENLEFINSFQFTARSIEALTENLYRKNNDKYEYYTFMKSVFLNI